MGLSFWQIAIVVLLLVLLFGRGKISELMGDMARGIKSFKKGMQDDPEEVGHDRQQAIDAKAEPVAQKENARKDEVANS